MFSWTARQLVRLDPTQKKKAPSAEGETPATERKYRVKSALRISLDSQKRSSLFSQKARATRSAQAAWRTHSLTSTGTAETLREAVRHAGKKPSLPESPTESLLSISVFSSPAVACPAEAASLASTAFLTKSKKASGQNRLSQSLPQSALDVAEAWQAEPMKRRGCRDSVPFTSEVQTCNSREDSAEGGFFSKASSSDAQTKPKTCAPLRDNNKSAARDGYGA